MWFSDLHLHLVTNASRVSARRQFAKHKHFFYELGVVAEGEAVWEISGMGEMRVGTSEAILVAPEQVHGEECVKLSRIAWVGFLAPKAWLREIPCDACFSLRGWEDQILARIDELLLEDTNRPPGYEQRVSVLLADLLMLVRRAASGFSFSSVQGVDRMELARHYLDQKAAEEITIAQVARYHGFSLAHFEVLFAKRFQCSPKQYQQACKLRRVERSIGLGIRSPKILAAEHGFVDVAYFCRWFKKQTGFTPATYLL